MPNVRDGTGRGLRAAVGVPSAPKATEDEKADKHECKSDLV